MASVTNLPIRGRNEKIDDLVNRDIASMAQCLEVLEIVRAPNFSQQPLSSNFNHIKYCVKTIFVIWVGNVGEAYRSGER